MTRRGSFRAAALLICAWLVLLASGDVVGRVIIRSPPSWDGALVASLHGPRHGIVTSGMRVVTALGGTVVLDVVFVGALAALATRRRWRDAGFLVLASPGTVLLVQLLKADVGRARPAIHRLVDAGGGSWPSGHASSSLAIFGALLILVNPGRWRTAGHRRRAAIAGVAALVALVGVSRVVLGVHYPTDVLGAWVLAGAWLTALQLLFGRAA